MPMQWEMMQHSARSDALLVGFMLEYFRKTNVLRRHQLKCISNFYVKYKYSNSLISTLGHLKYNARNWLRRHPHLHAFYRQNKFRIITSQLRGLPDFVIIGAQKSGTTSLYDFVIRHPEIAPALKKEMHYFSINYKFGEQWYRSNFPTNLSRRYFTKKTGQKLLSGEASPSYLFYPTVPSRMKKVLPDVKLIVILRNPVDRAYSQYHHSRRKGRETLSFEKAIELEEERRVEIMKQMSTDPDLVHRYYIN